MRRILVTGANKGIGLAIAKAILDEHADTFVYLAARDVERGKHAAATLARPDRVEVVALDVGDDASVTAAAAQLAGTKLYAVVNNAGIGSSAGTLAEVLNVNVLGMRRVSEAFRPLLEPNGRIVNVTSASGPMYVASAGADAKRVLLDPEITWPRLSAFIDEQIAKGESEAYGLSKACANAYTVLLARENPSLRINACTPGFIETDMTRGYATASGKSAADMGMKPPSAGARAPMFLLFGDPPGNGFYYGSDAVRSPLDRYRAPGSAAYDGA